MITQDKDKTLNIYRASAGSGKTHLLTGFYLKLLFVNDLLPEAHSGQMRFGEILAVTFTNKATAEMKGRIIEELFKLSADPVESDYWADLAPYYNSQGKADASVTARRISDKATGLLVQILNEYSSFNISTIDSFFQKIVRSFAHELNVAGNYEVELDADRVLDAAMSNFLDKLDERVNRSLFNWVKQYSEKRLEEGSGWDFRKDLTELAKKVLGSEEYHSHAQAIQEFTDDKELLSEYAKMLRDTIREFRDTMQQLAQSVLDLMQSQSVEKEDLFYKGAGIITPFVNVLNDNTYDQPGSRFDQILDNPQKLMKKGCSKGQDFIDQMIAKMTRYKELMQGDAYVEYSTAAAIQEHFYELGIIANIDKELTEYCNQQNIMLLSSTTEMLSRLIKDDDAPFIYEKTGTRIHSYMIDEFQDTSGMQWGNFKPLVSNALAEGYQNLIVGDVKQSIYRWRGGDWNLLDSEIDSYESELHHDDSSSLTTNWRSLPNIVSFNNAFFPPLAQRLDTLISSDRISRIYGDVAQQLPAKRLEEGKPQGRLRIEFLRPRDGEGELLARPSNDDIIAEAQRRLPEVIIELQQNGYAARDIAILCRRKKECKWAAEALLNYKNQHPDCPYTLDIISNEALMVASRPTVQALVNLMHHLLHPDSPILRAVAWSSYYQLQGLTTDEALARYFSLTESERLFMPELSHRPLYELTEELIATLPATACQQDKPFLQAFCDSVLEFASKQQSDLSGFLRWWEESGKSLSISIPEGQDAITILTVHKAKGLGMPAVVMPYASWEMDMEFKNNPIIWCEPKTGTFEQDILLPLSLRKSLMDTIFREDFIAEREKAVIDNVNTAYVAFTRAKETMVLMAPQPTDKTDLKDWLGLYCHEQAEESVRTEDGGIEVGSWLSAEERTAEDARRRAARQEAQQAATQSQQATVAASRKELPDITILHAPGERDVTARDRGTYTHLALQHIVTAEGAKQQIADLYLRGDIDPEVVSQDDMQQTIAQLLKNPAVRPWFSPELRVLNELGMMTKDGKQRRADRVVIAPDGLVTVIDYKTGSPNPHYTSQVRRYIRTLRDIGFSRVEGYLLYIKEGKVVKV